MTATTGPAGIADLEPAGAGPGAEGLVLVRLGQLRLRHHRRHRLFAPYIIASPRTRGRSTNRISVLGLLGRARARCRRTSSRSPRSSPRVLLPLARRASRTAPRNKKGLLAGFAWVGRGASRRCCSSCTGDNWQLGAVAVIGANLCLGASLVVNDSILPLISDRGRARPGLLAGLGLGLPRRRPAARAQPRAVPRPRHASA